jgi:Rab GDP dissociation inhibitor
MADGNLTKILLHSKVTRYLDFKAVDASYVYTADDGGWISKNDKIEKVPTTPAEALSSGLMGMFQKRKFRNFLIFMDKYDAKDPATYLNNKTLDKFTMREVFTLYDLDANTQSFIGHAMMLFPDDNYLDWSANVGGDALKLYMCSMRRFPPYTSPYMYPLYGLGGLPEGFSRMCAINGGTFMLNKPVDEVIFKEGVAWGIKSGNEVARAKQIIGDASYFDNTKTKVTGKVARSICILNHPIPNTKDAESIQIILPAAQLKRKNDVYVCMVSSAHNVCSANHYVAIVSTTVETNDPMAELSAGIKLLGSIQERFDAVSDLYEPVENGSKSACFISKSYDAASHFESAASDVLSMYELLTGEKLDMSIEPDLDDASA